MHCRLIGVPLQDGASQLGCEMGPSALRVAGLRAALEDLGHVVTDTGNLQITDLPEIEHPNTAIRNLPQIAGWTALLSDVAHRESREGMPIFLGGDHALSAGTVAGLSRHAAEQGRPLFVLWLDAHTDFHSLDTTDSGNLHGMPVSSIMGSAPEGLRPLLSAPLAPSQFRYVSAHLGDPGDWAFQRDHGLSWLESDEILTGPVHIHFDLDALNPAEFPHVAYPEGKLPIDAGLTLVRKISAEAKLVGLTITEFAPADSAGARDGSDVIQRLCEAARS